MHVFGLVVGMPEPSVDICTYIVRPHPTPISTTHGQDGHHALCQTYRGALAGEKISSKERNLDELMIEYHLERLEVYIFGRSCFLLLYSRNLHQWRRTYAFTHALTHMCNH